MVRHIVYHDSKTPCKQNLHDSKTPKAAISHDSKPPQQPKAMFPSMLIAFRLHLPRTFNLPPLHLRVMTTRPHLHLQNSETPSCESNISGKVFIIHCTI